MQNLTEKAQKILSFIIDYQDDHGYAPSIVEIRDAVDLKSYRGVTIHLDKLKNQGYISRDPKIPRAIKVIIKPDEVLSSIHKVPIVGEIKAGHFTLAEQEIEDYKEVSLSMLHGRKDAFLLRVKGDSMLNAGIIPGSLVVVVPQNSAQDGDIVVAFDRQNNEATLKRFKRMGGYMVLIPESPNPEYQPIIGKHFEIQGKIINSLDS